MRTGTGGCGAVCAGGVPGWASGVCAIEPPAANSARAIPTHAQETRNMLQSPEPLPNAALFV